MVINSNIELATNFFHAMYGEITEGFINLCTFGENNDSLFFTTNEIDKATKIAIGLSKNKNVYFGIGLRKERLFNKQRGANKDVSVLPCLFIEIDIKGGKHAAENLPDEQMAKTLLNTFPLEPSIINHSGGGLHCYWLLDEPIYITNNNDFNRAGNLLNRFQNVFIQMALKKGLNIDNTSDLARVFRVPGTFNHKEEPKLVQTIEMNDSRYTIAKMEDAIQDLESNLLVVHQVDHVEQNENNDPPSANFEPILKGCQHLQKYMNNKETATYDEWLAALTIGAYCEDYSTVCHELSEGYPGYSEDETDKKIKEIRENMKPRTCKRINEDFGTCEGCPFLGKINSPIALGMPKNEVEVIPSFWSKGSLGEPLQHDVIGDFLIESHMIIRYPDSDGHLYFYNVDTGIYEVDKGCRFLRSIIRKLAAYKVNQVREIQEYITVMCPIVSELSQDYIAVKNGLLDLKTLEFRDFTPDVFLINKIPTDYNPEAHDEFVEDTLQRVTDGHEPSRKNIEEMFGCVLYPKIIVPKMFYLYGRSAHNGKSSVLYLIHKTFNLHGGNISAVSPQRLATNTFASSSMYGKMANIVDDQPDQLIEDAGTLKSIITGGYVEVERKGKDSESVEMSTVLITASNFYPNFREHGNQINRRLHIIPFDHDFSSDPDCLSEVDTMRLSSTDSAREYVLKLAVDAVKRMLARTEKDKLMFNDKAEKANEDFAEQSNPLSDYFDAFSKKYMEDNRGTTVLEYYNVWCEENFIKYPLGERRFKELVCAHYNMEWKDKKIKEYKSWITVKGFKSK